MSGKKEFGDYQTPEEFSSKVCRYLKETRSLSPAVVIEPTCGRGGFIDSAFLFEAEEYYGIEINAEYCAYCRQRFKKDSVKIINADFFGVRVRELSSKEPVLIIGNPPWVNNSYLSPLGSLNLPRKENFKGLKGMEALTGASNFDLCESIILQLIEQFKNSSTAIAMLCKTSVARNVFQELIRREISFSCCDLIEFDAAKVFHISANACLLFIQLSKQTEHTTACRVFSFDKTETPISSFGYVNGRFFSDLSAQDDFDGHCCFEWRQGVKHDCAKIMELEAQNGRFYNGNKEPVEIERDIVFPLVKSSMFKSAVICNFSKYVIVTQKKVREETAHLRLDVPKTWAYLEENRPLFRARKSSIYRGAPEFSMFGVGEYSYSTFKVGVSGFYKEPLFSVLYSPDGKPVMTDDTSYFIGFAAYETAYVAMLYLNSDRVQGFLKGISFQDAKRPYTKKVLERIDFSKVIQTVSFQELQAAEARLQLTPYLTQDMVHQFTRLPELRQGSIAQAV